MSESPVPPFDATVGGVIALLPHASFPDAADIAVGQKTVTRQMISGFVEDITGRVQLQIAAYEKLSDAVKAVVVAAARDVVHNGAASYTQAARFPEQADKERDTYAEVLWQRYLDGLKLLVAQVQKWVDDEATNPDASRPGWCFPPAAITEDTGF